MNNIVIDYKQLCQSLVESSLGDLQRSTERSFGTDREDDSVPVRILDMVISPGQETLSINAKCVNSDKGSRYDTNLVFHGVNISTDQKPGYQSFVGSDGEQYYTDPVRLTRTQVQVSCTCLDFYWTFAQWNGNDNSLVGAVPEPYTKTTDRGPRNPNQTPGICKHLYAVGKALQREGIVR